MISQSNTFEVGRKRNRSRRAPARVPLLHRTLDTGAFCPAPLAAGGEIRAKAICKPQRNNYAWSLIALRRFEEAKSLMRRTVPVARCVLGDSNDVTFRARRAYAVALYKDPDATLDDLREAVTTLEDTERTARRVLGGAHPTVSGIEDDLQNARAMLVESLRAAVEATAAGDA